MWRYIPKETDKCWKQFTKIEGEGGEGTNFSLVRLIELLVFSTYMFNLDKTKN